MKLALCQIAMSDNENENLERQLSALRQAALHGGLSGAAAAPVLSAVRGLRRVRQAADGGCAGRPAISGCLPGEPHHGGPQLLSAGALRLL